MARNRVIYQSEALFVSEDASSLATSEHEQLQRVQSANYSFSVNRQDINQFGQMARIDSMILEAPTVSLDLSYYLGDGFNERALGFHVGKSIKKSKLATSFASGHMETSSGKNFYIVTVPEGKDANSNQDMAQTTKAGDISVIGLGNAYLSDYSVDFSVGSLPTVSCSFECANINCTTIGLSGVANGKISGIHSPAVKTSDGKLFRTAGSLDAAGHNANHITLTGLADKYHGDAPTALRAGDVEITFQHALSANTFDSPIVRITGSDLQEGFGGGTHIQSASLSVPLSRTPLERLGNRAAYARTVDFPINASLSVSAIVNEQTSFDLARMITGESAGGFSIEISCKGDDGLPKFGYIISGAKLDSESFSSSIGSNKSVDLTFSAPIGGITDTTNNISSSGSFQATPFA